MQSEWYVLIAERGTPGFPVEYQGSGHRVACIRRGSDSGPAVVEDRDESIRCEDLQTAIETAEAVVRA